MQKVIAKNGKKLTVFNKYIIGELNSCPECGRPFKPIDIQDINNRETISCPKCGAKLSRK